MKKGKRIEWIFCLLVIWTAAAFQGYALTRQTGEEKSLEAFRQLNLSSMEGYLEISASVQDYKGEKEQREILEKLAKETGAEAPFSWREESVSGRQRICLYEEKEGFFTELSFTTQELQDGQGKEQVYQYIYVTLQTQEIPEKLLNCQSVIEKRMKKMGLDSFANLNFKGMKAGKMSMEEKKQVTDRLFHSLEAEEVEAVREEELYTVYGYSRMLKDSIAYGENEINLNLAFTYDEEKNRTMFYLSMPYIRMDY